MMSLSAQAFSEAPQQLLHFKVDIERLVKALEVPQSIAG